MSFHLPWKPLYTQSGAAGTDDRESSWIAYGALAATVAFTVVIYLLESILDARQKASYQKTTFPKELETTVGKIDAESEATKSEDSSKPLLDQLRAKFTNSQSYGLDKINFGMISSTYDTIESIVFIMTGFFPYMWDTSASVGTKWFGWTPQNDEIKITLIFLLLITLVGTVTSLPFELYSTFQIERKHGFNKQTIGLFVSDKIKSLMLTCVIGGPFIALLLKIIQVRLFLT